MASIRAVELRSKIIAMPSDFFESLTFGELQVDDMFIAFPLPGDNSGHGGFIGKHLVFLKNHPRENPDCPEFPFNATDMINGIAAHCSRGMLVIQVSFAR